MDNKDIKVLIVGTNMMNIYNHRIELIKALIDKNYKVYIAAPKGGEEKELIKMGCSFINIPVENRGKNFVNDLKLLRCLIKLYKKINPDVILTFYTKTNIYGGIASRITKFPYIVNITGLGTALSGDGLIHNLMMNLYKIAIKKSSNLFFQNLSNKEFFINNSLWKGKWKMLPGSGVSLERFNLLPYPKNDKLEFVYISRILKEKGIDEYLEAASYIKDKYPNTVFHVVGPCEPEYISKIKEAENNNIIKYHGKVYDTKPVLKISHCLIYPSYYPEGMANVLLEAAASGRPVITTNLPGCGETLEDGITGFIIKEKDSHDLINKIEQFISLSDKEKEQMGLNGRNKMENEFDRKIVTKAYLESIEEILNKRNK